MLLWKRELRPGARMPLENDESNPGPATENIEKWMWGLEEDAPKVEQRNGNCWVEGRNVCSQHAGQGSRWCRWQGRLWFPRDTSGGSPSSGSGSSNQGKWSKVPSSWPWWVSRESNQPVWAGRGLRVKVNLPIFKKKKTKDAVTYYLWWWDIAIFLCSGCSGHCRGSQETWPGV